MALKINILLFCLLLWAMPRLAAQCPLPLDISMDSTVNLLWEQYLERGDLKYEETNKRSYERHKKVAANPRLDSLFRVSRQYMVEHLAQTVFCEKVDMELFGAFSNIPSQFTVQYRFYYDKVGKDNHYRLFQFMFVLDEAKRHGREDKYPQLPDCRENPNRCNFKVTTPDQAIQIAEKTGWINKEEVEYCSVNDNWEWVVEKTVNDHCGKHKIYVDMRSGVPRLSTEEAWTALEAIEKQVKSSPIVIEAKVLESDINYYVGSQPQISCIVEVNQLFKGEMKPGVIEVFGSGIQTTHGGLRLPPKGQSAIFFLKDTLSQSGSNNVDSVVNSLSAYPLFRVNSYPIEIYQPYIGHRCYHVDIEKNLYQTIEKAAEQPRQLVLLPAERDSAVAEFASRKKMNLPVRQLGLEYMLFNKYSYGQRTFDTLRIDLAVRSISTHSYLTKGVAIVRYSQVAYGDSIVSKKRLRFKPIQEKKGFANWHNHYLHIPDNYEFELKDLSDSTFQIRFWRPNMEGDYFQLTPIRVERLPATAILELKLPVLQKEANLHLDFVEPQMQDGHFHFDFEQNKEVPYKYVWLNDPTDFYENKRKK